MSGHVVMKLPVTSCPLLQPFLSYCISQLSKNMEIVLLINYLTWRGVFVIDDTFPIKKHKRALTLLGLCRAFFRCGELGNFLWGDWAFASRSQPQTHDSFLVMTFLSKSGSWVVVCIRSLATAARCSFCSGSRSRGMDFAVTHFMPRSCVKISDTNLSSFWRPQISFQVSHRQSLIFVDGSPYTFDTLRFLLVAGLTEHGSLPTGS